MSGRRDIALNAALSYMEAVPTESIAVIIARIVTTIARDTNSGT